MPIAKGDFVEIDYTGRVKDSGLIFDTTREEDAKSQGIGDDTAKYGPVIVCIGEGQLLRGLEAFLEGKEPGKYQVLLAPEDAFGRKNAKYFQLMSLARFKDQQVQPVPGLQVNIDGMYGVVKSVSGGRVVVDFNHPLAGRELEYEIEAHRIITEPKEKLDSFLRFYFSQSASSITDGAATITVKSDIPKPLQDKLSGEITRLMPEISSVSFISEAPQETKPQA